MSTGLFRAARILLSLTLAVLAQSSNIAASAMTQDDQVVAPPQNQDELPRLRQETEEIKQELAGIREHLATGNSSVDGVGSKLSDIDTTLGQVEGSVQSLTDALKKQSSSTSDYTSPRWVAVYVAVGSLLLSVSAIVFSHRLTRRSLQLQSLMQFSERYVKIVQAFSARLQSRDESYGGEGWHPESSIFAGDHRGVREYFALMWTQHNVRSNKLISDDIWEPWVDTFIAYWNVPLVRKVWYYLVSNQEFNARFIQGMHELIPQDNAPDGDRPGDAPVDKLEAAWLGRVLNIASANSSS